VVQDKREIVAEELLEHIGCDISKLKLLGQGAYNTVYKGLHPDQRNNPGVMVAFKVVSGSFESVKDEKFSAMEIQKLQPRSWSAKKEEFSTFVKAMQKLQKLGKQINPNTLKRTKYYAKYMNTSQLIAEFNYEQVKKILTKCCKGNKNKLENLWPSPDPRRPKETEQVAYIFISPLAQGDMWKEFEDETKNLEEFEKRLLEIKKAAKGTLKALVALHSKGRLHLDIKPDNILKTINDKGKPIAQLADFGLLDVKTTPDNKKIVGIDNDGFPQYAKQSPTNVKSSPSSSNFVNVRWKVTDWYKAPEQIKQKMLEITDLSKIDIYSLGATLFIMYLAARSNKDKTINFVAQYGGMQPLLANLSAHISEHVSEIDKNPMTSMSPIVRQFEKNLLDLIINMTKENPKDRPTALQALNHNFFNKKL